MATTPEEPKVLVEVGAGTEEFTSSEISTMLALAADAQRRADGLNGVLYHRTPPPLTRLATLLREAGQDLPVPEGCTGYRDEFALIAHDGDTCPVHELYPERG